MRYALNLAVGIALLYLAWDACSDLYTTIKTMFIY